MSSESGAFCRLTGIIGANGLPLILSFSPHAGRRDANDQRREFAPSPPSTHAPVRPKKAPVFPLAPQ